MEAADSSRPPRRPERRWSSEPRTRTLGHLSHQTNGRARASALRGCVSISFFGKREEVLHVMRTPGTPEGNKWQPPPSDFRLSSLQSQRPTRGHAASGPVTVGNGDPGWWGHPCAPQGRAPWGHARQCPLSCPAHRRPHSSPTAPGGGQDDRYAPEMKALLCPGNRAPGPRLCAGLGRGASPLSSPDTPPPQTPHLPRPRSPPPGAQALALQAQLTLGSPDPGPALPGLLSGRRALRSLCPPCRPGRRPGAGCHQPHGPLQQHIGRPGSREGRLVVSVGPWPLSQQISTPRGAG